MKYYTWIRSNEFQIFVTFVFSHFLLVFVQSLFPNGIYIYSYFGNPWVVQWLGFSAFTAVGPVSIPSQGTKILKVVRWGPKPRITKQNSPLNSSFCSNTDLLPSIPSHLPMSYSYFSYLKICFLLSIYFLLFLPVLCSKCNLSMFAFSKRQRMII